MIYWMARVITRYITAGDNNEEFNKDEIEYKLKIYLNLFFIFAFTFVIAIATGHLLDTLISTFSLVTLRMLTGGRHLKSSDLCVLYSTLLLCIAPYIANIVADYTMILNFVCLMLIITFAPYNVSRPLNNDQIIAKILAILFILINFFFVSPLVVSGILIQSIDIISYKRR